MCNYAIMIILGFPWLNRKTGLKRPDSVQHVESLYLFKGVLDLSKANSAAPTTAFVLWEERQHDKLFAFFLINTFSKKAWEDVGPSPENYQASLVGDAVVSSRNWGHSNTEHWDSFLWGNLQTKCLNNCLQRVWQQQGDYHCSEVPEGWENQ